MLKVKVNHSDLSTDIAGNIPILERNRHDVCSLSGIELADTTAFDAETGTDHIWDQVKYTQLIFTKQVYWKVLCQP